MEGPFGFHRLCFACLPFAVIIVVNWCPTSCFITQYGSRGAMMTRDRPSLPRSCLSAPNAERASRRLLLAEKERHSVESSILPVRRLHVCHCPLSLVPLPACQFGPRVPAILQAHSPLRLGRCLRRRISFPDRTRRTRRLLFHKGRGPIYAWL
jgi:hypothetical protein